jgi:hypothetical protein
MFQCVKNYLGFSTPKVGHDNQLFPLNEEVSQYFPSLTFLDARPEDSELHASKNSRRPSPKMDNVLRTLENMTTDRGTTWTIPSFMSNAKKTF